MKIWRAGMKTSLAAARLRAFLKPHKISVTRIEELMGVPIVMVSVGPEREQMIIRA